VNTPLRWITLAVCSIVAVTSASQATAQRPVRSQIVIVDVAKVFKEHIRLKQAMSILGDEVKAYDSYLRDQQGQMKKLAEQRQQLKPSSPEYKEIDAKLARQQSDLQVEMQLKKKAFMEREAKHFYNTYDEVSRTVAEFADANGIRLVLRFNGAPMDRENRASVLQGVNNDIVYQKDLDITDIIIAEVNKGSRTPVSRNNGNQIPPFRKNR